MKNIGDEVGEVLFGEPGLSAFAVLDGASVSGLLDKLYALKPEHVCLYRGELQPDMAEVAPYLVRLERGSGFTDWVLTQGWGGHWGIFALAQADLAALRTHFRKFLVVHDSAGKPLLFRYYDPRVLRKYLPTCDQEQLAAMFGPVASYVAEGEQPSTLVSFRTKSGALAAEQKELSS